MKLTTLLIMFGVLQLSANVFSQQTNISLKMNDVSVRNAIDAIEKVSGYDFFFSEKEIDMERKISFDFSAPSLEMVVAEVFGSAFKYRLVKNIVIVSPKAEKEDVGSQQKKIIKGKVVDNNGNPLPGVSVVVRGTTTGVSTDMNGEFSFELLAENDVVLSFSFVGMKTKEFTFKGQKDIKIVLEEEVAEIEEVVVTGYQKLDRKNTIGNYVTLKAEDIKIEGANNIADMLQGRVAGMVVTNSTARVGASPKIQIRGQSTLLGNQDPIWVVDGIIQPDVIPLNSRNGQTDDLKNIIGNQVSWLNPEDIETITVLKDASATAIYGSRASNGVIVITTKKTAKGKTNHSYSGSMTIRPRATYDDFYLMNSQERLQFSEAAAKAGMITANSNAFQYQRNVIESLERMYIDGQISRNEFINQRANLETMNTDWLDIMTRTSISQSHNISLGSNLEKLSYRVSIGYVDEKGQEIFNDNKRLSVMATVNSQIHKNVRLNFNINGSLGNTTGAAGNVTPLNYALNANRAMPAFNEDGSRAILLYNNIYQNRIFRDSYLSYNALTEFEETSSKNKSTQIATTMGVEWNIIKGLSYKFNVNFILNRSERSIYRSERSYSIAKQYRGYDYDANLESVIASGEYDAAVLTNGGVLDSNYANINSWNIQNMLFYNNTFGGEHKINVMLGQEVRSSINSNYSNTIWGFYPERGNALIRPTAPDRIVPGSGNSWGQGGFGVLGSIYDGRTALNEQETNFMSIFTTIAYSYSDRYVANINIRNDFTNAFGLDVNKRIDPIYSFGIKWNVMNEPFLKDKMSWINGLDFSATYGIQGNSLTAKTPEMILVLQGISERYKEFYSKISSIPNPKLSWERTTNWNFAVNGRIFNLFNFSVDYYTRNSNAVFPQVIPAENGIELMDINGGMITNKGIEASVAFAPVLTKDFGINIGLNFSRNWNKGGKQTKKSYQATEYLTGKTDGIIKEGYPLGAFWRYSFKGLNPENGAAMFNYMDVDPEEAFLDPTLVLDYVGTTIPYFTGGLNFNVRYKNLSLSSNFSVLLGGYKELPNPFAALGANRNNAPDPLVNLSKELTKRWQKPGDELFTDIPAISREADLFIVPGTSVAVASSTLWEKSTARVIESSFLRCNSINMTYNFNGVKVKKIGLNSLRVSLSVANPFVIANKRLNGFDPELDNSVMPKSYSLNIGFSF